MMLSIVDYGLGNVGSLLSLCAKIGVPAARANTPKDILAARALILPGVGRFDAGVQTLRASSLLGPLCEAVQEKGVPVLGICLGMQMLAEGSEEGVEPGLGFIPGWVAKFSFPDEPQRKIPNMGWLGLCNVRSCALFPQPDDELRFYFVHSYHMVCTDPADVIAQADYGGLFTASVNRGSVWGTQFHPEKSHKYGMALLRAYAETALAQCKDSE